MKAIDDNKEGGMEEVRRKDIYLPAAASEKVLSLRFLEMESRAGEQVGHFPDFGLFAR